VEGGGVVAGERGDGERVEGRGRGEGEERLHAAGREPRAPCWITKKRERERERERERGRERERERGREGEREGEREGGRERDQHTE